MSSSSAGSHDILGDLQSLAAELRRLEAEYSMFFAGRLPRPPWETRSRVEAIIKRWSRVPIEASTERFRFNTLQARFTTFRDLWDRGMRAREEGRPGPFMGGYTPPPRQQRSKHRIAHETSFTNPRQEKDKLTDLYDSLMAARREAGEEVVPFRRFAKFVRDQVKKVQLEGDQEVAFRVAVKDGQVNLTVEGKKA